MEGDRLALSVTSSDGRVVRWGGDEPNAEMIPGDLEFSTSVPGGYKDLSCSLLRRLGGDERLFDNVRVYGPGNRTAWDGRLVQFPREDLQVNPGAVGWSSHLRDDPSFLEVYVDRDASRWREDTLARKLTNASSGRDQGKIQVSIGQGGIAWDLPNEALPANTYSEVCYDAPPGVGLNLLQYRGTITGTTTSLEVPNLYSSPDGSGGFTGPTALTLDSTIRTANTPTATYRSVLLRVITTGAVTPAAGTSRQYDLLSLHGNHGLTAIAVSGDAHGYYGHDLIEDIVSRTAPLLTTGGIEPNTSFVVPQAVFSDPTTGEDAIMLVNGYFLNEWGVYDDREFFWRAPDVERLVWRARADRGAHVSLEGETAEAQFNGVLVSYTDPLGVRKLAGPPAAHWQGGTARADVTNAVLVDTTSTNSVNRAGIPRRWGKLEIGPVTTDAGAVQLGYVWLAEHSLPQRRGTITISGSVEHPTEGQVPPWRVRAGDSVQVTDLADDQPRRIIETRYSRGTDTLTATVGNTDFKLDAILERLGVQLVGVL